MKTVFERIIERSIPATIVYEDAQCIVIHDLEPQAPVHLLIIPKQVIQRVSALEEAQAPVMGHLFWVAKQVAQQLNLASGYRLVINCGEDAGETVPHLHVHLLAGRSLEWPPG
jgi:histidine triad (HIT) family protein